MFDIDSTAAIVSSPGSLVNQCIKLFFAARFSIRAKS